MSVNKLTVASYFSGGGLFDCAFKEYFGEIIWANELNPYAATCYRHNIGDHIVVGDITKIPIREIPAATIAIGGPPCTNYSSAGTNVGEEGDAGKLVWVYQEIIREKQYNAFVMENVVGLTRGKHKSTLDRLVRSYVDAGYSVSTQVINSADLGVAQHRERVFMVGIRKDLGFTFRFPPVIVTRKTVREAIGDLPIPETVEPKAKYLGKIPNHLATWTSPTPERIQDILKNPRNQWRGVRRFSWDQPGFTLTHHMGKDGRESLHPEENRRITVREALRLMSMPNTFIIPKEVTIQQQYFLTGNGVPYLVGKYLAKALFEQLISKGGGYGYPSINQTERGQLCFNFK